ncbi:glutamate-5-semialdehyde dehydrogenase [Enterorhabdus sp. NM05_H27]|nr:glutamate-5-semialdehyde dehydrogenase [Enterorhabdus sp. NM05_H27]
MDIRDEVVLLAKRAKEASARLAVTTAEERNGALAAMAAALREHASEIVEANGGDMAAARAAGTSEALLDRLMLDEARVGAMADALDELRKLPDPLGVVSLESTLYNGIRLRRVSVPLGVVAMVYEARPNVTADAAGVCVKSGNACVLRGGSLAARSNEAIADILAAAAVGAGLPEGSICAITTTDRAATDVLMELHGLVDVLIPRGGAGLIRHCVEHAKVPVIETGTGNCHVYVHASADPAMARDIIMNAKCRRLGVCNAAETLLVDAAAAPSVLPPILGELLEAGITVHGDEMVCALARQAGLPVADGADEASPAVVPGGEADWETEYLGPHLAVRVVEGPDEAIAHVNRYGTKHSEAIVATDEAVIDTFLAAVDAAAVYANASTAFTDGGQFGLGAEIGISTQKIHARGPFAADALTSYKYVLRGDGQVRA